MTDPENYHLSPLGDEEWPPHIADLAESFAGRLNVYRVMARSPELLRAWAPLRQYLVADNTLGKARSDAAFSSRQR